MMNDAELQLKAGLCTSGKRETEWLGVKKTSSVISPIITKVQGITEKLRPTNPKELLTFLGAVNKLAKFTQI